MKKKLAVITVNYQNYAVTEEFIECFKKMNSPDFKVFISDLSVKRQIISHQKWLEVILSENKGYARGVNVGIERALSQGYNQFVVMNNDTRVEKDFINTVQKSLNTHPRALVSGKIYYEAGYEYHTTRYKKQELGHVLWYAGGLVDWKNAYTTHRGVDEVDQGRYDLFEKTEFITGCLMLFDKAVIDAVGPWDERYFLYYEDADWCERAKRKNISLYYDPTVVIWHKNAQSTGGAGSSVHKRYQEKNRLIFGLKYAPFRTKIHLVKDFFLAKIKMR